MSLAVELRGASKTYGSVTALQGVSLCVPQGGVFAVVGPNGAGKTTLFALTAGLVFPSRGEVYVFGRKVQRRRPPLLVVAAQLQGAAFPSRMRVKEALRRLFVLEGVASARATDTARRAMSAVGIESLSERRVGRLSFGEQRKVALAQAFFSKAPVVLLDEPTAGLDPRAAAEVRSLISGIAAERTVILSSHNLHEVETVASRVAILERGQLRVQGDIGELSANGGLEAKFLDVTGRD